MSPRDLGARLARWAAGNRRKPYFYADSFTALANGQRPVPSSSDFDQFAAVLYYLEHGGARPRLQTSRQLVSRNWIAMRAFNRLVLRDDRRLWPRVLSWQSAQGLFADSPLGGVSPLTYHAKFCLVLAMAVRHDPTLQPALDRALDALTLCISPGGVLVPYGRSRATLFGYAAATVALLSQGRPIGWRLYDRMLAHLQPDGHIPAVLGCDDRDVYVNDSDYNAYAAALLLWLPKTPPREEIQPWQGLRELGPLVLCQTDGHYLALVGTGQSEPWNTPFFCDHRTFGLQPLWWERDGQVLATPAPYDWNAGRAALARRAEGKAPYYLRTFPRVQATLADGQLTLQGTARPTRYRLVPRWLRGLLSWLAPRLPQFVVQTARYQATRHLRVDLARQTISAWEDWP